MAQVSYKLSTLSRLAIALFTPKQQTPALSQDEQNSSSLEMVAHQRAIEQVQKVRAIYQMQGWMR
ncbi:hypothetical protein IFO70_31800 [Phormidium tenue FACHB-886]|nr:hypothetical protein [Phormidium tenue FACHB-886]